MTPFDAPINPLDLHILDQKSWSFQDLIGQPKDSVWTPVDISGAGLVIAIVDAVYMIVGRLGIANMAITYPVTANGANAQIGGFPFKCRNLDCARMANMAYSDLGVGIYFMID